MAVRKAVILAGGYGTRLMEETEARPKPIVEIGGRPMLWHVMKLYSRHGIDEFIIPLGYKGYMIKEFFANYRLHMSDVTFDYGRNDMSTHAGRAEAWKVTLVDTGLDTNTGGRLKRLTHYLGNEPFCMTYGDGVAQLDIRALIDFHLSHGRAATITAVRPPARFGALEIGRGGRVERFQEKPPADSARINGGFFVLSPRILDSIEGDQTIFEREPLERLAEAGELMAWEHDGFWFSMDWLRDKRALEEMWARGDAPWTQPA